VPFPVPPTASSKSLSGCPDSGPIGIVYARPVFGGIPAFARRVPDLLTTVPICLGFALLVSREVVLQSPALNDRLREFVRFNSWWTCLLGAAALEAVCAAVLLACWLSLHRFVLRPTYRSVALYRWIRWGLASRPAVGASVPVRLAWAARRAHVRGMKHRLPIAFDPRFFNRARRRLGCSATVVSLVRVRDRWLAPTLQRDRAVLENEETDLTHAAERRRSRNYALVTSALGVALALFAIMPTNLREPRMLLLYATALLIGVFALAFGLGRLGVLPVVIQTVVARRGRLAVASIMSRVEFAAETDAVLLDVKGLWFVLCIAVKPDGTCRVFMMSDESMPALIAAWSAGRPSTTSPP